MQVPIGPHVAESLQVLGPHAGESSARMLVSPTLVVTTSPVSAVNSSPFAIVAMIGEVLLLEE
jgi:hypothetical protein